MSIRHGRLDRSSSPADEVGHQASVLTIHFSTSLNHRVGPASSGHGSRTLIDIWCAKEMVELINMRSLAKGLAHKSHHPSSRLKSPKMMILTDLHADAIPIQVLGLTTGHLYRVSLSGALFCPIWMLVGQREGYGTEQQLTCRHRIVGGPIFASTRGGGGISRHQHATEDKDCAINAGSSGQIMPVLLKDTSMLLSNSKCPRSGGVVNRWQQMAMENKERIFSYFVPSLPMISANTPTLLA
ncbi:hypothetical protein MKZ38_002341 [Zalerion maritima]|uniref:Uncharacterized protein n=1 Tax=Zalerion maritima TaxID=339359 RepID=A0AAD5WUT6_9PEZI|nr:hypothetical protein MKZ38_002341 [Zalerion maritima]